MIFHRHHPHSTKMRGQPTLQHGCRSVLYHSFPTSTILFFICLSNYPSNLRCLFTMDAPAACRIIDKALLEINEITLALCIWQILNHFIVFACWFLYSVRFTGTASFPVFDIISLSCARHKENIFSFVSYVLVTVKILCVFVVSHGNSEYKEIPENSMLSGILKFLWNLLELSLGELYL